MVVRPLPLRGGSDPLSDAVTPAAGWRRQELIPARIFINHQLPVSEP
ncbi:MULTISPECIES: hypothetical protein [unclassified Aeromonas]|nr:MULTISPECIES: hypothetical protein [unclassified Aeromonas]MBP4043372.1 hypothetical protein [Aeromonas sp. SrichE-2G]QXB56150.1 hypothetical protein I6L45_07465 [Aeromonas sp. FDAARGOS 1415]